MKKVGRIFLILISLIFGLFISDIILHFTVAVSLGLKACLQNKEVIIYTFGKSLKLLYSGIAPMVIIWILTIVLSLVELKYIIYAYHEAGDEDYIVNLSLAPLAAGLWLFLGLETSLSYIKILSYLAIILAGIIIFMQFWLATIYIFKQLKKISNFSIPISVKSSDD